MIQPHDYAIEINADQTGVWVSVRHTITGSQLSAKPGAAESVGAVRNRLIAQIEAEIYDPDEFEFAIGHTRMGAVAAVTARDYLSVTHKPTGVTRAGYSSHGASHRELLDEVLTELWRQKVVDR